MSTQIAASFAPANAAPMHFYADKSKARRAALTKLGEDAIEGEDYDFVKGEGKKVAWFQVDAQKAGEEQMEKDFPNMKINPAAITFNNPFSLGQKAPAPNAAPAAPVDLPVTKVVDGKKATVQELAKIEIKVEKRVSAKAYLRERFTHFTQLSLQDMINGGYTESNIRTAISDLKNPKYAGGELLEIVSEIIADVRIYSVKK